MNALISVVIPVYNGELYVKDAINSVLNQPFKEIEIICIDDGSIDNSFNLINEICKFEDRIKILRQGNSGVATARNIGIRNSSGKYIAFLDQDDIWCSNSVTNTIVEQLYNEEYDLISFAYYYGNQDISRVRLCDRENALIDRPTTRAFENYRHHSSYLYKRSFLIEYNIETDEFRNEDERFRMQCIYRAKKMLYISTPLFVYRNNKFSVTHSEKQKKIEVFQSCINGFYILSIETKDVHIKKYSIAFLLHTILEMIILCPENFFNNNNKIDLLIEKYNIIELLRESEWLGKDKNEWNLLFNYRCFFLVKHYIRNNTLLLVKYIAKLFHIDYFFELKKYPLCSKGRI